MAAARGLFSSALQLACALLALPRPLFTLLGVLLIVCVLVGKILRRAAPLRLGTVLEDLDLKYPHNPLPIPLDEAKEVLKNQGGIFLSGATGLVGGNILAFLLTALREVELEECEENKNLESVEDSKDQVEQCRKIHVAIRQKNGQTPAERFEAILRHCGKAGDGRFGDLSADFVRQHVNIVDLDLTKSLAEQGFRAPSDNRKKFKGTEHQKNNATTDNSSNVESQSFSKSEEFPHSQFKWIIHCAADVSFTMSLREAMEFIVCGSLRMLEIAHQERAGFLFVSTAFVHPPKRSNNKVFRSFWKSTEANTNVESDTLRMHKNKYASELVDFGSYIPTEIFADVMKTTEASVGKGSDYSWGENIMKKMGYTNTYAFAKAVAEHVLLTAHEMHHRMSVNMSEVLPFRIVRPAVVIPAWSFPYPGWHPDKPTGLLAYAAIDLMLGKHFWSFPNSPCIKSSNLKNLNSVGAAPLVPVDLVSRGVLCAMVGPKKTSSWQRTGNQVAEDKDGIKEKDIVTLCIPDKELMPCFARAMTFQLPRFSLRLVELLRTMCPKHWHWSIAYAYNTLLWDVLLFLLKAARQTVALMNLRSFPPMKFVPKALDAALVTIYRCRKWSLFPAMYIPFSNPDEPWNFESDLQLPDDYSSELLLGLLFRRALSLSCVHPSGRNIHPRDALLQPLLSSSFLQDLTAVVLDGKPLGKSLFALLLQTGFRALKLEPYIDLASLSEPLKNWRSNENVLVASTHRSMLDFLLYGWLAHKWELGCIASDPKSKSYNGDHFACVADMEFLHLPVLGQILRALGACFVRRGTGRPDPLLETTAENVAAKRFAVVFLEGSRSRDRRIPGRVKTGFLKCLLSVRKQKMEGSTASEPVNKVHKVIPAAISFHDIPEHNAFAREMEGLPRQPLRATDFLCYIFELFSRDHGRKRRPMGKAVVVFGSESYSLEAVVNDNAEKVRSDWNGLIRISNEHIRALAAALHFGPLWESPEKGNQLQTELQMGAKTKYMDTFSNRSLAQLELRELLESGQSGYNMTLFPDWYDDGSNDSVFSKDEANERWVLAVAALQVLDCVPTAWAKWVHGSSKQNGSAKSHTRDQTPNGLEDHGDQPMLCQAEIDLCARLRAVEALARKMLTCAVMRLHGLLQPKLVECLEKHCGVPRLLAKGAAFVVCSELQDQSPGHPEMHKFFSLSESGSKAALHVFSPSVRTATNRGPHGKSQSDNDCSKGRPKDLKVPWAHEEIVYGEAKKSDSVKGNKKCGNTFVDTQHIASAPEGTSGSCGFEEYVGRWGYSDTRFFVDTKSQQVQMSSARYQTHSMPHLLRFLEESLRVPFLVSKALSNSLPDSSESQQLPPVRSSRFGPKLESLGFLVKTDAASRWRAGSGHGLRDVMNVRFNLGLFPPPDCVVVARSHDDVINLICQSSKEKLNFRVVPFGGGTNVTGATRARDASSIALDLRALNSILWVNKEDGLACVQAGMNGKDLKTRLEEDYGVNVGMEPDSMEFSTVGGWVSTFASGMKRNLYGNIEDMVVDCLVVTPDLGLVRCSSNGALGRGPGCSPSSHASKEKNIEDTDMNSISNTALERVSHHLRPLSFILGSEGGFGVIVSVTLKVHKVPKTEYNSVLFQSFEQGERFMRAVSKELGTKKGPSSCRLMDNFQMRLSLALGDTVLWKRLLHWYIGLDSSRTVCAATMVFEGESALDCADQRKRVEKIVKRFHGRWVGASTGEKGYNMTFHIAYIRDFLLDIGIVAESFETFVPWSKMFKGNHFIKTLKQRIKDYWDNHEPLNIGLGEAVFSVRITQLYHSGCVVYMYLGFHKGELPADAALALFERLEEYARKQILELGGSLSHHHGIGRHRAAMLNFQGHGSMGGTKMMQKVARAVQSVLDSERRMDTRNGFLNQEAPDSSNARSEVGITQLPCLKETSNLFKCSILEHEMKCTCTHEGKGAERKELVVPEM